MMKRMKVSRNHRLLVKSKRQYQVLGPGRVWLKAGQRLLATLYVGPQDQYLTVDEVQTVEKIPVGVTLQIEYRIDPDLFTHDLLPHLPKFNEGHWQYTLKWQIEYVLRQLLADYSWRDLGRPDIKQRLERQLVQTLSDRLKEIALNITSASLINAELPADLQQTIIQAEQDEVEAQGRATVLKEYFDLFGDNLSQAMPYVVQWELMNMLHKNGNPQLLLTASNSSFETPFPEIGSPNGFRMNLPVVQAHQQ